MNEDVGVIQPNKTKRLYIAILFMCILLSGADLLALNFSGANLRIMYLIVPIFCFCIGVKLDKTDILFLIFLLFLYRCQFRYHIYQHEVYFPSLLLFLTIL